MRKIEKDLSVIPTSLNDRKTETRRNTVIRNGIYPSKKKAKEFNKRFKQKDILDELDKIYNSKCVYCEEKITKVNAPNLSGNEEISHAVEHYRPKSKYAWLAFSWDNLLWCCKRCTDIKANQFEIENTKVVYSKSFDSKIHCCTKLYNRIERPKIIHPELEDVPDKLIFNEKGKVSSNNDRVQYTIDCCGLDREYLNVKRKKILDDFIKDFRDAIVQEDRELQKNIVLRFKKSSENMDNEFIAFRVWVVEMLKKTILQCKQNRHQNYERQE
jgi:uncharacterized protein (TIGR02646 family)